MGDAWNDWLGDFIEPLRVRESLTRRVLWKRCRCTHDEFIRRDILILVLDQIIKISSVRPSVRPSASCLLDHNIFVSRASSNVWYHRLNYSKRVCISLFLSLSLSLSKRCSKHIFHSLSRVIKRGKRQSFEEVIARRTNIIGIDLFSLSLFRFHYFNFSLSPFLLAVAPNLVGRYERREKRLNLMYGRRNNRPVRRNNRGGSFCEKCPRGMDTDAPRIPYEIMYVCQLNGIHRVCYKDGNNGAGWNVERKGRRPFRE